MTVPNSYTLGTLLRHLIETLDGAVEAAYADLALDYRPRYTPVVRVLRELGPASIRSIAQRAGITHSAVSQTVTQMIKDGLVKSHVGEDARERVVDLSPAAKAMLPTLDRQWAITNEAANALDRELSTPLSTLLREAIEALERRPFRTRLNDAETAMKKAKRGRAPTPPSKTKVRR